MDFIFDGDKKRKKEWILNRAVMIEIMFVVIKKEMIIEREKEFCYDKRTR